MSFKLNCVGNRPFVTVDPPADRNTVIDERLADPPPVQFQVKTLVVRLVEDDLPVTLAVKVTGLEATAGAEGPVQAPPGLEHVLVPAELTEVQT